MNYKNELKIKIFNFSKQLLYSLIMSGCVVIIVALLVVRFFNCAISVVLSDSMLPAICQNDLLIIKSESEYREGDIIQFNDKTTGLNITHRIIGIKTHNDKNYLICYGDNLPSVESEVLNLEPQITEWKNNARFVDNLTFEQIKNAEDIVQIVEQEDVLGKVIQNLKITALVVNFVLDNFVVLLLIVILVLVVFHNYSNIFATKKYLYI